MKTLSLKSLSLLGLSLLTALSVEAQSDPKLKVNDNGEVKYKSEDVKVKTNENETKYKSDDLKVKMNENESKYKSDDVKVKVNENEAKYKSDDLKIKTNENETKIKGEVRPMRRTASERTEMRTGETNVMTKTNLQPISTETTTTEVPAPAVVDQVAIPKDATTVRTVAARKPAKPKAAPAKRVAARKASGTPRTIVRTKVVRDTVMVPSPPERIVSTRTEYVRDTVVVTRVDTVIKTQTVNTYDGYNVPRGDFKKVKLERKKDGTVEMKRKE